MERKEYEKIYHNGTAHLKAADLLAEQGHYGFAVSHIILGLEELMKYKIVKANSFDTNLFFEEIFGDEKNKTVFTDHKTKHNLLEEYQKAISPNFPETYIKGLLNKQMGLPLTPEQIEIENNPFRAQGNMMQIAFNEMTIPVEEKENFFNWLKSANFTKNKGFYVNKKNGLGISPASITKKEYEKAARYGTFLLEQFTVFRSLDLTDEEFIGMMNSTGAENWQREDW